MALSNSQSQEESDARAFISVTPRSFSRRTLLSNSGLLVGPENTYHGLKGFILYKNSGLIKFTSSIGVGPVLSCELKDLWFFLALSCNHSILRIIRLWRCKEGLQGKQHCPESHCCCPLMLDVI